MPAVRAAKLRRIDQQLQQPKILPAVISERAATVDEFGRLSAQLDAIRPLQLRHEQLRQRICEWYAASDADQSFSEDGAQFAIQVGPRASKRVVSNPMAIFDRLGAAKFLSISTISLEKLDTLMLPADQVGCVTVERAGPRTIRPVPKFAEPAA